MAALKYWLWLTTGKGMDSAGVLRVLDHFITPERAYYADPEEYDQISGLSQVAKKSLCGKDTATAEKVLESSEQLGLRILTLQDADYPDRLRQIEVPPPLLYIKGRLPSFDEEVAIGVVGARKASDYGVRTAGTLGLDLARGGALLVSGIAEGVDSAAVKGALRGGGTVVSLLAGGIDVPYPRENRFLYNDVAAAGALISEYPPGTRHMGHHFPLRNRIISGLCLGVVAVECKIHSGTMITMHRALDQNRDVFAVPGNVDAPLSRGTNLLIQQGAKLVTCGEDILVEYRHFFPEKLKPVAPLNERSITARLSGISGGGKVQKPKAEPEEPAPKRPVIPAAQQRERYTDDQIAILQLLQEKSGSSDELVEGTQIPARRILSALTMLQVDGSVVEGQGKRFEATVELEII